MCLVTLSRHVLIEQIKEYVMRTKLIMLLMLLLNTLSYSLVSVADTGYGRLLHGYAVTGTNRLRGEAQIDFGGDLGRAGFYNVAVWNEAGNMPLEVNAATPGSAILATGVDSEFLALLNITIDDVDPALLNVPLRDVPSNIGPAGLTRIPLPGVLEVSPMQPSQAAPNELITLSEWLAAQGFLYFRCHEDRATVYLQAGGLIPNRIYTVWAIHGGTGLIPRPLGGAPNVFVTDERGKGRFKRLLNFCPLDQDGREAPLLLVDVVLHSDQQVYGDVPDLPFAGLITGIITHTQLEFAVEGHPVR